MQFTARQIGEMLHGVVEGNPDVVVDKLAKIEEGEKGSLAFLSNPKYESFLYSTKASVVIVNQSLQLTQKASSTLIRVEDAYSAFSNLLDQYNTIKLDKVGIENLSFIHPSAKIGQHVYIGAFAYIGQDAVIGDNAKIYPHVYVGDNAKIGNNSTLFSGVKIGFDCELGDNVIIHAGTVIGSDGFGFAPQTDGSYKKISQIGVVIIENEVEIGANACIDRATMGATIIRKGAKLDNLIQIAHNVEIGSNTVIASQTGISGSTKIHENCIIGGQVGVVGHITVAKGSQVQAKSGINRSITQEYKKWGGIPATSFQDHLRSQVVLHRLPELERKLEEMRKVIENLIARTQ